MTATTLSTTFGPVKTGSTAAFIAVVKAERLCRIGTTSVEGTKVLWRAETSQALETRLRRAGLGRSSESGLWFMRGRSSFAEGAIVPGELIATVEIVEVAK
jgi:hypothetical protein